MEVFTREDYAFWPEGILEVVMSCGECGHRSVDVFPIVEQEPSRQELHVNKKSDLKIRVIKSSKARIEIPELGIEINPGKASQGYITNVEGILDRVEGILLDMVKWKKKGAKKMLERIKAIREELSESFTLVVEDPSGCSVIISEETKRFKL
jgi:zinc finger protein